MLFFTPLLRVMRMQFNRVLIFLQNFLAYGWGLRNDKLWVGHLGFEKYY